MTSRPVRSVAVVIPALDEEESLPAVLAAVPEWVSVVVVADNGSIDRTPEVARELGAVVVHESERGYGAACLAAIDHLERSSHPPEIVVFVDGDGSDDPAEMGRLVEPIERGVADITLGVREGVEGDLGTILPHAKAGNLVVLSAVRALFGKAFQDLPPFRAISFRSLRSLAMDDRNWGWTLQMQVRAHLRGLRIEEVRVTHRHRSHGSSKISGSLIMSLKVGAKMFYTLGRERLRG